MSWLGLVVVVVVVVVVVLVVVVLVVLVVGRLVRPERKARVPVRTVMVVLVGPRAVPVFEGVGHVLSVRARPDAAIPECEYRPRRPQNNGRSQMAEHGSDATRGLVELRIHGVSGTPPEGMLDAAAVDRVAGDATTGFYEPDPNLPLPAARRRGRLRWLEGYSWRGMTSGSPVQALWVLLAPFAFANTAAAMRPPVAGTFVGRAVAALHAAAVRVFALSLTLTFVMATFVASVDETAWQCGNNPSCVTGHSVTRVLGWSGLSSPPRRVAIVLALPLASILLLWFLARRAWNARAAVLAVVGARDLDHVSIAEQATDLDDPKLWEDREPSEYLRHVHVASALGIVTAVTAIGIAYWSESSATALRVVGGFAFVSLGAATVAAAIGWGTRSRLLRRVLSVGALVGSGAAFVALVAVLVSDPTVPTPRGNDLPGVESVIVWLFLVQIVMIVAIGVLGMVPWTANRRSRVGLRGAGSALVCGLALVIGAMFSAGVVLRVGDYLGQTTTQLAPGLNPDRVPVVVPNALTWAARGTAFLVVVLAAFALAGGAGLLAVRALRGRSRQADARARAIAVAERRARLTDRIGSVVLVPALVALVVAVATTVVVVMIDTNHYRPAFEVDHRGWIADHATIYGSWMITAFAAAMVLMVLRARSNESLRRKVGIVWDLTTFWPRHAQPLGPPCYTDRALPELVFRITWYVKEENQDVIFSAHSQGTVIAAPVVLQLRPSVREHVALLTYGSPLQRLYARWFPAFFNRATFDEMGMRLCGKWQNLYRNTDPIGGSIPAGPGNVVVEPDNTIAPGDFVYPPIRAHSDYPLEPAFTAAVGELDERLRAAPLTSRRSG